ncbi:MAG: hypothetical protein RMK20_08060 [Verrucomicrobiales bacterium]|nr:hypothetical protein [Verrucomicrobiales bacterium]
MQVIEHGFVIVKEPFGDGFDVEGGVEAFAQLKGCDVRCGADVKQGESFGCGAVLFARAEPEPAEHTSHAGGGIAFDVDNVHFCAAGLADGALAGEDEKRVRPGFEQFGSQDALARVIEPVAVEFGVNDLEVAVASQAQQPGSFGQLECLAASESVVAWWDGLLDAFEAEVRDEKS